MSVALLDPAPTAALSELDPTHEQGESVQYFAPADGSLAALAHQMTEPLRAIRPSQLWSETNTWPRAHLATWVDSHYTGIVVKAPTASDAIDMADAIAIILAANGHRVNPPQLVQTA